jgi:hypothetical protein
VACEIILIPRIHTKSTKEEKITKEEKEGRGFRPKADFGFSR